MSTIKIMMPRKDAEMAQKLFDEDNTPGFTITNIKDVGDDMLELEICYDCSFHVWFLARQVQMHLTHEENVKKLEEKLNTAHDKLG